MGYRFGERVERHAVVSRRFVRLASIIWVRGLYPQHQSNRQVLVFVDTEGDLHLSARIVFDDQPVFDAVVKVFSLYAFLITPLGHPSQKHQAQLVTIRTKITLVFEFIVYPNEPGICFAGIQLTRVAVGFEATFGRYLNIVQKVKRNGGGVQVAEIVRLSLVREC